MPARIARKWSLKVCLALGSIAAMHVRRHELVGDFSLFLDNKLLLCANLVVKDLKTDLVAVNAEMLHDGIIGDDAILVLLGFEWSNNDGV